MSVGQPFHADGVRVVQIDHQGGDRLTERRAGFQLRLPGATAVTRSPQQAQRPPNRRTCVSIWLDGRQFDALVDLLRDLRCRRKCRLTLPDTRSERRRTHDPGSGAASVRTRGGSCAAACRPLARAGFCPCDGGSRGIVRRLGRDVPTWQAASQVHRCAREPLPIARPATG